jgi:alpha/beta superfamily hydrolase
MEDTVRIAVGDIMLDGRLAVPATAGAGVVVCHPHPQYGGSMENDLVIALTEALGGAGLATLRFDFRGIGASGGRYDDGRGEVDDVRAAAAALRSRLDVPRVCLVGYSFGSVMALRAGTAEPDATTGIVAIAPPVRMLGLDFLAGSSVPIAFVTGDRDQFCPLATLESARERFAPASTVALVPGADHFFGGHLDTLAKRVVALVQTVASSGT